MNEVEWVLRIFIGGFFLVKEKNMYKGFGVRVLGSV